ncbi:portal protein [Clostridia bacterium]|nr:portal protein [Clostridia bacterium]
MNERTALQSTAVYACVRVLSEAIAGLPLHVYRYKTDGGKERSLDHPLYNLLHNSPNPDMTSFIYRETMMAHLLLWGNSYSQIIRNARGQVVALYPLLPQKMEVGRAKNGELTYTYWRDSYDLFGNKQTGSVTLRRDDVLHIPGLGFDGLVGFSPISLARNAIGLALATEAYGGRFFANSANPGGVLEHPGVVRDPDKLRQSWQSQFSGENAHRICVLEEGLKFHPISINPADSQFLESRKFQVDEIARLFRVPPHLIGDLEKATYSNIEHQSLEFVKHTLNPWVVRIEQSLMKALVLPSEQNQIMIRFNLEGLLRGDQKSRYESYSIGIQNGFMSPNDVREIEDWNLIPDEKGGYNYYCNGNMITLTTAAERTRDTQPTNYEEESI